MRVVAENRYLTIHGPIPLDFLKVISRLSGRKMWSTSKYVKVEGSNWNIKILKESGFELTFEDATNDLKEIEELKAMLNTAVEPIKHSYHPKHELKNHQKEALDISCFRNVFAWYLEMGLGKTALAIANACILFMENKIQAVLILAPKGVHKQWISEEIPKHIDPTIPLNMTLWSNGQSYESEELKFNGRLNIFSLNIDSVNTKDGWFAITQFLRLFGAKYDVEYTKKGERKYINIQSKSKIMMIIDEAHQIGNFGTLRTKEIVRLGRLVSYRRVLTGTPLATSLINIWCQFMFLDSRIIGIDYITAFKSRYCEEGGYSGHEVVGGRNVEEFYSLIAPHSYRKTKKECLDLPEKIYATRLYQLGNETRWHYENIKNAFMTELKSGNIVAPANGLAAMVRLQQIMSGFLPDENENEEATKRIYEIFSYERAEIALDIANQMEGPVCIWARFIPDIKSLRHIFTKAGYGNQIATYDRINEFRSGEKRFLIANQARGIGGNPQDSGCLNLIYYNNSFNYIHRVQSEDRFHRWGMKEGTFTIIDIMADKTIDKGITDNLKGKKSLSNLVLDDIRQLIEN
jgi:SNF2 family DNA or RNA helicase